MKKGGWGRAAATLLLGTVIGTLAGQVAGAFMRPGTLREMFLKGARIGVVEPLKVDLAVFQLAFGFTLSVNPLTVAGFLLSALIVYRFSR